MWAFAGLWLWQTSGRTPNIGPLKSGSSCCRTRSYIAWSWSTQWSATWSYELGMLSSARHPCFHRPTRTPCRGCCLHRFLLWQTARSMSSHMPQLGMSAGLEAFVNLCPISFSFHHSGHLACVDLCQDLTNTLLWRLDGTCIGFQVQMIHMMCSFSWSHLLSHFSVNLLYLPLKTTWTGCVGSLRRSEHQNSTADWQLKICKISDELVKTQIFVPKKPYFIWCTDAGLLYSYDHCLYIIDHLVSACPWWVRNRLVCIHKDALCDTFTKFVKDIFAQ